MSGSVWNEIVQRKYASGQGMTAPLPGGQVSYADPRATVCQVDQTTCRVKAIISTVDRDRSGDVVLPQGCRRTLDSYRRNPVVLFAHQHTLPVGQSQDDSGQPGVNVEDDSRLTAWCQFSQSTQDAMDVFALVADGTLRQASIGFVPHMATRLSLTPYGKAHAQERERDGLFIEDFEIVEWSYTPIADNPGCEVIRAHLSRGRITAKSISPALVQVLEPFAAPAPVWSNGVSTTTTKDMNGQAQTNGATPDVPEAPQMPHTAATAKEVIDHIKALLDYLDEIGPVLEPKSDITAHFEAKLRPALNAAIADLHGVASEEHPDQDFGKAPRVEQPEDQLDETDVSDEVKDADPDADADIIEEDAEATDDDAPEKPPAKKKPPFGKRVRARVKSYMNRGHRTICKEAAEWLDDMSEHESITDKGMKYGCKWHAKALKDMSPDEVADVLAGDDEGDDSTEMDDAVMKAIAETGAMLQVARASLSSLTGRGD